ncbi:unnamed protein product, partial [Medioppia subpectinata]
SAGSWSVSAHILSPLSKGLFKRAIMESGAQFDSKERDVVNKTEAISQGKAMATQLKCNETENWIQCLRRADANDILKCETQFPINPLFETEFLPITAQQAFDQKKFNTDIDLLVGITHDEASGCPTYLFAKRLAQTVKESQRVYFYELFYGSEYFGKQSGHYDSDWPQLLNDNPMGMPKVHGIDPTNLTLILNDPFHQTCDGVWARYFL